MSAIGRPIVALLVVLFATPLAAQTPVAIPDDRPVVSLRPFFVASGQRFSAVQTFNAVFGRTLEPFWGGGVALVFREGIYVDFAVSRFKKTGQRAYWFDGQAFPLAIPLTATETPIEFTAGYRFALRRYPYLAPYLGAGIGSYLYKETSDFANAGENLDTSHAGYLAVAGAEFRVSRWINVSGDVQYTHVPGILGAGGISQEANESDLGGVAVRFRVLVGR